MKRIESFLGRRLSRQERRLMMRSNRENPSFTREPFREPQVTVATDELGNNWEAFGHIDLKPLGFVDHIEGAKIIDEGAMIRIRIPLPTPRRTTH